LLNKHLKRTSVGKEDNIIKSGHRTIVEAAVLLTFSQKSEMEKILLGHIVPPFVIAGLFPNVDFPVRCPTLF